MCEPTKRQQIWEDTVIEKCNETKYRTISPGICGECSECQSQWGMELESSDFKLDFWYERDRLYFGLVDRYTEQTTLIEFWDDDARQFLEDWGITTEPNKLQSALWEHCEDCDITLSDEELTTIFNEKIEMEVYIDEGGFSCYCCDCCGNPLGGDKFAVHGFDENGELLHYDVCSDCLYYLANGDIPEDDYLDWIKIEDNEESDD